MIKHSLELERLFQFLAKATPTIEFVMYKGAKKDVGLSSEQWDKAITELQALGLVRNKGRIILKNEEFFKAQTKGFTVWFAEYKNKGKRMHFGGGQMMAIPRSKNKFALWQLLVAIGILAVGVLTFYFTFVK